MNLSSAKEHRYVRQSRAMSAVESVVNVLVGYFVAVTAQIVVFPWFGLRASLGESMQIGAIFTFVSILRSYVLRRTFEAIRARGRPVLERGVA